MTTNTICSTGTLCHIYGRHRNNTGHCLQTVGWGVYSIYVSYWIPYLIWSQGPCLVSHHSYGIYALVTLRKSLREARVREKKEGRTEGTPRKCPFLLAACWCSYNGCSCWLRHCCLVGVLNSTGNSHGFPAVAPWDAKSAKVMLSIMRTISQSLWKAMLLSLLQKMQQVCMEAVVIECCPDAMTVS